MSPGRPDRSIETLIRLAGGRDAPSPEGTERARAAAEQAWRHMLAQPAPARPRRWLAPLALALAAGVAALVLFGGRQAAQLPPELVAQVALIDGVAMLQRDDERSAAAAAMPLYSGSTLEAMRGRIAVVVGGALSLRLDQGARVRFEGRERVTLLQGSLYVDSGGVNLATPLRIDTPAGEVRHVGTQYQLNVAGDSTRVRVREGRVMLERGGNSQLDLASGDEIVIRDGQARWRHDLPSHGPDWEWVSSVAPMFEIENRPLAEFLSWLVREHGWQLRYATEELQQQALEIRLHGSFAGLDADAMLERITLVTGVPLAVRAGVLWVGAS